MNWKLKSLGIALILNLAVQAGAQQWGCVQNNPQHTGTTTAIVSDIVPVQKWSVATGGSIVSSPVIRTDGSIVVGDGNNKRVSAYSADGNPLWSYEAGAGILGSPAVLSDGKVLFSDMNGTSYVLNSGGTLNSSISNSTDAKSERRIISDMTPRPGGGYATADWRHNLLINTGGSTNREIALAADVYPHAPVTFNTDGSRVYCATRQGANNINAMCLNSSTGATIWSVSYTHSIGAKATSQMSGISLDAANNRLFFCANYHATTGAFLYSLNATNGAKNTGFPISIPAGSYCTPALAHDGSAIHVTTLDGRLLKFNAATGAQLWSYNSGAVAIRGSAVVDGIGRVVFADTSGQVHCLNKNGQLLWKYQAEGSVIVSTPAIAANGEVVFTTTDGQVVSLTPKPLVIPYIPSKTPVLDGILSPNEYDGAWEQSVEVASTPAFNPGWDVPQQRTLTLNDCSYNLYMFHNGDSLYVAFNVNDEVISTHQAPVPNSPPPANGTASDYVYEVWWDDCTEVFIDADHDGINENYTDLAKWPEGIHAHFGVLGHVWANPDVPSKGGTFGASFRKGWWAAAKLRPGGYVHEYRLKLSEWDTQDGAGFTPLKPGDTFGLNFLVNDDDEYSPANSSDRREDQVVWWGSDTVGYDTFKFANTWPVVKLSTVPVGEETRVESWEDLR